MDLFIQVNKAYSIRIKTNITHARDNIFDIPEQLMKITALLKELSEDCISFHVYIALRKQYYVKEVIMIVITVKKFLTVSRDMSAFHWL
jgi:hypothetical protein